MTRSGKSIAQHKKQVDANIWTGFLTQRFVDVELWPGMLLEIASNESETCQHLCKVCILFDLLLFDVLIYDA